jgi:hypothetical protein
MSLLSNDNLMDLWVVPAYLNLFNLLLSNVVFYKSPYL